MMATTNSNPARFPQKVTNQCSAMHHQGSFWCNAVTVVNRNKLMYRLALVNRIIARLYRKSRH